MMLKVYNKTTLERNARERRSPENEKLETKITTNISKCIQIQDIQGICKIPSGRRPGPAQAQSENLGTWKSGNL